MIATLPLSLEYLCAGSFFIMSQQRLLHIKSMSSKGLYFAAEKRPLDSSNRVLAYTPSGHLLATPTMLLISLLITGYPFSVSTCLNVFLGCTTLTFGNDIANFCISGYSSPVFTNTASISGYISRAICNSTVLSLPPEKEI